MCPGYYDETIEPGLYAGDTQARPEPTGPPVNDRWKSSKTGGPPNWGAHHLKVALKMLLYKSLFYMNKTSEVHARVKYTQVVAL